MTSLTPTDLTRLSYPFVGNFASVLPLGILTLNTFHGLPGPSPTAPDNWNWAPPLPWISSRRGTLESELEFLNNNDFIRATYCMQGNGIAKLRIYVLPEDCEWYLLRESRTEFKGRALLKKLWDMVDTNPNSWNLVPGSHHQVASLYAEDDVSLNLSTIFNTLPSPQPDLLLNQNAPPIVRDLLESVLEDEGVPGFKSQLYHYQRESVWKMLQRELLPQKRHDPRLRKWVGPTGIVSWINTDDMTFFRHQQYVDDIRGGILCEEMGTGKTVQPLHTLSL
jgi:SNF2-related domain